MIRKHEYLQRLARQYREEHGDGPVPADSFAVWALAKGYVQRPRQISDVERVADQFREAMRVETRRDRAGFEYRANHAYTESHNGKQMTFWVDADTATKPQLQRAFAQRREQVVGDVVQMALDLEHYNNGRGRELGQIDMLFDFTDDIADRRALLATSDAA